MSYSYCNHDEFVFNDVDNDPVVTRAISPITCKVANESSSGAARIFLTNDVLELTYDDFANVRVKL
jgi:hypothetical protein